METDSLSKIYLRLLFRSFGLSSRAIEPALYYLSLVSPEEYPPDLIVLVLRNIVDVNALTYLKYKFRLDRTEFSADQSSM